MPSGEFLFPTTQESLPFWSDNETITNATPTVTGSGDQLQVFLGLSDTFGGSYIYELATNGAKHTFSTTGKWIKWKLVGINYIVTRIECPVNT